MSALKQWKRVFFGRARSPHPGRTALYQLYPQHGGHLYIGISNRPTMRFRQHAETKSWWPEVDMARTQVRWYRSRRQALRVEARMIRRYRPPHNYVHNPDRGGVRRGVAYRVRGAVVFGVVGTVLGVVSVGHVFGWWVLPSRVFLYVTGAAVVSWLVARKNA